MKNIFINKANEWQELSLKKDVEKISKALNKKEATEKGILFEIVITFSTIIIDKYDETLLENFWALIILLSLAIIPTFSIIKEFTISKIKTHNRTSKQYTTKELIDAFDNEVCYCVMTAESFKSMLCKLKKENTELGEFYYIESWYYINKAKSLLFMTLNKTQDVFTQDPNFIISKNMISLSRLINVAEMIENLQTSIDQLAINKHINLDDCYNLREIHIQYDKNYKYFIDEIREKFSLTLKYSQVLPSEVHDFNGV